MRPSTELPSTRRTDAPIDEATTGGAGAWTALPRRLLTGPALLPGLRLPNPLLVAAAGGMLVALCAVLAGWGDRRRTDPAGFDLRAEPASPNVDNTSAKEEPETAAPPP